MADWRDDFRASYGFEPSVVGIADAEGAAVFQQAYAPTESPAPQGGSALKPDEERQFQSWFGGLEWNKEFQREYGEAPDPNDPNYDYRAAWKAGVTPQRYEYDGGRYHWPSEAGGVSLKGQNHPTRWMNDFMTEFGFDPHEAGVATPEQYAEFRRMYAPTDTGQAAMASAHQPGVGMEQTPQPEDYSGQLDADPRGSGTMDPVIGKGFGAGVGAVVEGALKAPQGMLQTAVKVYRAGDIDVADREQVQSILDDMRSRQDFSKRYADAPTGLADAMQSMPYSLTTMGASIGAGAIGTAATGGNVPAGVATGMAASGAAAYRATRDDFMSQLLVKAINDNGGKVPSPERWKELQAQFDGAASEYGAWEAIPEAVGNALFLKIIGPGAKWAANKVAGETFTRIGAALVGTQAEEQTTEAITQWGQGRVEARAGLRDKAPTFGEAVQESAPATFWQTLLMGGAGSLVEMNREGGLQFEIDLTPDKPQDLLAVEGQNQRALPPGGGSGPTISVEPQRALPPGAADTGQPIPGQGGREMLSLGMDQPIDLLQTSIPGQERAALPPGRGDIPMGTEATGVPTLPATETGAFPWEGGALPSNNAVPLPPGRGDIPLGPGAIPAGPGPVGMAAMRQGGMEATGPIMEQPAAPVQQALPSPGQETAAPAGQWPGGRMDLAYGPGRGDAVQRPAMPAEQAPAAAPVVEPAPKVAEPEVLPPAEPAAPSEAKPTDTAQNRVVYDRVVSDKAAQLKGKRASIRQVTAQGETTVEGTDYGNGLAVVKDGTGKRAAWTITHTPSGRGFGSKFYSADEAKRAVALLAEVTDWKQVTPESMNSMSDEDKRRISDAATGRTTYNMPEGWMPSKQDMQRVDEMDAQEKAKEEAARAERAEGKKITAFKPSRPTKKDITGPGGKRKKWMKATLNGAEWITDGALALPSAAQYGVEPNTEGSAKLDPVVTGIDSKSESGTVIGRVDLSAVTQNSEYTSKVAVAMAGGKAYPINLAVYNHVRAEHGDKATLSINPDGMQLYKVDGKPVAVAVGYVMGEEEQQRLEGMVEDFEREAPKLSRTEAAGSRTPAGTSKTREPIGAKKAREIVSAILGENAAAVQVVETAAELPENLRSHMEETGGADNVVGAYHEGTVYIMGDQVDSAAAVTHALRHELGHVGLNRMLDNLAQRLGIEQAKRRLDGFVMQVWRAKEREVRTLHDRYPDLNPDTLRGRIALTHEWLVERGAEKGNAGWVTRFRAALARFFRAVRQALGLRRGELTDAEIDAFVGECLELGTKDPGGGGPGGGGGQTPVFARKAAQVLGDVIETKNKGMAGWEVLTRLPSALADKYPPFKAIYERQLARIDERQAMLAGHLNGLESLFGSRGQRLDGKQRKELTDFIWQWEGKAIPELKGVSKFKAAPTGPGTPTHVVGATATRQYMELNPKFYAGYRAWLGKQGLDPKVADTYFAIRETLDGAFLQAYNKMLGMKDVGDDLIRDQLTNLNAVPNYFPHHRYGKYYVALYDTKGDTLYREHYDALTPTLAGATGRKRIAELRKQYPGAMRAEAKPVRHMPEELFEHPIDTNALQQIASAAAAEVGKSDPRLAEQLRQELEAATADIVRSRGWGAHGIGRKNVPGHETEMIERVLYDYLAGLTGWATKIDAAQDMSKTLGKMRSLEDPTLYDYAAVYVKNMLRNTDAVDKLVGNLKGFAFLHFLGGSLKTAVVNLSQQAVAGIPVLGLQLRTADSAAARLAAASGSVVTGAGLSADEKRLLKELHDNGVTQAALLRSITARIEGGLLGSVANKATEVLGMPMAAAEEMNRKSMAVAAYRAARAGEITEEAQAKHGISGKATHAQAKAFAESMVRAAHFTYGKANLPQPLRSSKAGRVAAAAYTFRSYNHNLLELWVTMLRDYGWLRGGSAMLKSVAATAVLGGLRSVPMYASFLALANALTGDDEDWTTRIAAWLKRSGAPNWLRDMALYGVPALAGVDIGGSLRLEAPIIGDTSSKRTGMDVVGDIIGIPYAAAKQVYRVGLAASAGRKDRALEEASPVFLKNILASRRLAREGAYSLSGKPLNKPGDLAPRKLTVQEAIVKTAGFQPLSMSKDRAAQEAIERSREIRTNFASHVADRLVNGIRQGDNAMVQDALDQLKKWNAKATGAESYKAVTRQDLLDRARARIRPEKPSPRDAMRMQQVLKALD